MANTYTIQVGANGYMTCLKPGAVYAGSYSIGAVVFEPSEGADPASGIFTLKINGGETIFANQSYTNIINGDTGVAFASVAALQTYINTNFFRKATSGGGIWGSITGNLSDQTDLNSALSGKSPLAGSASITTVGTLTAGSIPYSLITGFPAFGNATGSIGLSANNGVATTFMRSDATAALSQAIAPTWIGKHTYNQAGNGTTPTDVIVIGTTLVATSGVPQQFSGGLNFLGYEWNTSGTPASHPINFRIQLEPQTGANDLAYLTFKYSKNGGAYSAAFNLSTDGNFIVPNGNITLNKGFIGATTTDGIVLDGAAASSAGTLVQKSTMFRQQASIWNSTVTAAANYTAFGIEVSGVSGAVPTGRLDWYGGIGVSTTVTLARIMSLDNSGNLSLLTGGLLLSSAGAKFNITEGTNSRVGQVTLVAGTLAITIAGLTTSSRAFPGFVAQAGTSTGVSQYKMVCTANTLTITAVTVTGTTVATDTSTVNYFVIN